MCAAPTRSPSSPRTSTSRSVPTTSLLELGLDGAVGWVAGYPNAFPAATSSSTTVAPGRPADARARCTATCTRCCGGTRSTEFVQAIKLSHGRRRAPRRPDPPAPPAAARRARRPASAPTPRAPRQGLPLSSDPPMRTSRSSTPSTPTPRGCPPASSPAASASSPAPPWRSAVCTSWRTPRRAAHAADVRAARARRDERRDPAAADPSRCRLGRALHRGLRLPADVRARHDRRRDRARRDGHGGGRRAGHHHPPRHPGRARRRRGRGRRRARATASPSRTCRRSAARLDASRRRARARRRRVRPRVRRQLLRDRARSTQLGLPFDRARKDELLDAGPRDHGAINDAGDAACIPRTRHRRLPPRLPRRARLDAARLPARDGHPPRLVRPLALRHRHLRADGAAARPRRAAPRPGLRQRVVHRHELHRPARRDDRVAGLPAVIPTVTGRAWVTGTAQYLLDPTDPFPQGFVL